MLARRAEQVAGERSANAAQALKALPPAGGGARFGALIHAARAGATIAALLCTLFFVNAVANRKDVHANLSYFKAALPSEYTRDLVASMEEETEALLFFPEVSEVREAARPFFEALDKLSGKFRVTLVDPAMAPEVARQHRVTQDGTVVIARGTNSEKLVLGDTMDAARGKLRSLDAELQKMVLKLTVERKTVYVISGHGERPESTSEEDPRPPLGALTKILKSSNMSVKKLGPVEGLGGGVPEDAAMIVWTDPSLPPFPGETEAITDYLDAGGRMLLTLDPSSDVDLKGLLDHLGLRYSRTLLANDKAYIPIKRVPTDKHYLITTAFSSHPAVGSFSRQKGVVPVFFPGVGSLQKNAGAKPKITFAVRAPSGTWGDDNGDGVRGEGETPGSFNLVAAVSAKTQKKGAGGVTREPLTEEMRVVVLADTDLLSDEYIGFRIGVSGMPGNLRLLADSLEWLVGQGQVAPATEGEEDVRIAHTRDEDVFWFYVTIFAVPLLILGLGVITRWGRGRGRRAK